LATYAADWNWRLESKLGFKDYYNYIEAGDFNAPRKFSTFSTGLDELILCKAIQKSAHGQSWNGNGFYQLILTAAVIDSRGSVRASWGSHTKLPEKEAENVGVLLDGLLNWAAAGVS
jgi:hypothetical protein